MIPVEVTVFFDYYRSNIAKGNVIEFYNFKNADTIMDLLNCSQARRAILDYYQASGEPQAVQEAIKTSQESASKTVTMERMRRM